MLTLSSREVNLGLLPLHTLSLNVLTRLEMHPCNALKLYATSYDLPQEEDIRQSKSTGMLELFYS